MTFKQRFKNTKTVLKRPGKNCQRNDLPNKGTNLIYKQRHDFGFVLAAPVQEIFGVERHPSIFNKAATYLFYIIKDHIFCDGNKRTGMVAAFTFLDINGIEIRITVNWKRIVNYAERIAGCKPNIEHISKWLKRISNIQ
jgi:death-on-curing family protein